MYVYKLQVHLTIILIMIVIPKAVLRISIQVYLRRIMPIGTYILSMYTM